MMQTGDALEIKKRKGGGIIVLNEAIIQLRCDSTEDLLLLITNTQTHYLTSLAESDVHLHHHFSLTFYLAVEVNLE